MNDITPVAEGQTPGAYESDFADNADTTRVELRAQRFVVFKNYISGFDQKRIEAAGITAVRPQITDGESKPSVEIDPVRQAFARLEVYIRSWNLTNREGRQILVSAQAIRNLSKTRLTEIDAALDRHVETMDAVGKQKEDAADGEPLSSPAS